MRRFVFLVLVCPALVRADPAFDAAAALVKDHRYPEARAAFEQIVAAEPNNGAACHELGLLWKLRGDTAAYEEGLKWLARASDLEPQNSRFLGDYGGTSLELAGRLQSQSFTRAYSLATKGRDTMEKAVALAPDYLEARIGLFQFYQRAPWPVGSSAKAALQLEEIRKRDPSLGTTLAVSAKADAKDYDGAFKLCEQVLGQKPDDYTVLYQYGRTASVSGQNLERGLAALEKCLTTEPPGPSYPSHSNVWFRIGVIRQKRSQLAEARAAFECALKLDPGNQQAASALSKLK